MGELHKKGIVGWQLHAFTQLITKVLGGYAEFNPELAKVQGNVISHVDFIKNQHTHFPAQNAQEKSKYDFITEFKSGD